MKIRVVLSSALLAPVLAVVMGLSSGCGTVFTNLLAETDGTFTTTFVNRTPYAASFSYGGYDAWDRDPPGAVDFNQLTVAAFETVNGAAVQCNRNFAIGTQDFVDRVLATEADVDFDAFEPDRFSTVVHFSDAPDDTDPVFLPTAGTARGLELKLGNDFSCGDNLVFIFVEDPDAEGGFRIDFELLVDEINQ